MKNKLWEILIPKKDNFGVSLLKETEDWEYWVAKKTGGLTVMPETKGTWIDEGIVYKEFMIPVRISCSEEDIKEIAKFSLDLFRQEAIAYYPVSDDFRIVRRGE